MGLDQYLNGRKFLGRYHTDRMEDGYPVDSVELALGYWRKHPNLHGYIVETFAEGKDECQEIELNANQIVQIIEAVEKNRLPKTDGFFFGSSPNARSTNAEEKHAYEEQKKEDLDILGRALGWLTMDLDAAKPFMKYVVYRASW